MAEQDSGVKQVHYGARQVGTADVYDYWSNKPEAAQAASLPGWELVKAEWTEPAWVVIPNPLAEGGTTPR
jgi:hypothetical protein